MWFYSAADKGVLGAQVNCNSKAIALFGKNSAYMHVYARIYPSLLVVVQGQCTMGCAADESGMEGGFSAL
jgi:hypothetical protein